MGRIRDGKKERLGRRRFDLEINVDDLRLNKYNTAGGSLSFWGIHLSPSTETVDKTVDNADVTVDNSEKILAFIREHGSISNRQARQITDLSATGVRYLLQKLSREGRIVSAGGNRNRTYSLSSE